MAPSIAAVLATAFLAGAVPHRTDPFTGMLFVRIVPGTFEMGSPAGEKEREPQEVQHRVPIARPYYLGVHEVTQPQWVKVTGKNPSNFRGCPACPVERVSYFDVAAFIGRLNRLSSWPGFRLPTEAEWEYACRAGGTAAYGATDGIDTSRANHSGTRTRPVGSYPPNAWGLFDMSGNVWEWTSDDYVPYPGAAAADTPSFHGHKKVIRGGSWRFGADSARCALRYTHSPKDSGYSLGVRLAHDAA
jgi:formylglycine-generating enzyme required for sulfatase activity